MSSVHLHILETAEGGWNAILSGNVPFKSTKEMEHTVFSVLSAHVVLLKSAEMDVFLPEKKISGILGRESRENIFWKPGEKKNEIVLKIPPKEVERLLQTADFVE
ncbi:hypothetical protein HZA38_05725 [Candidatus Peregrinibacteria bacterium]|nr:hypothetical protein [Candidatus Peregrinibacteria bacterium]